MDRNSILSTRTIYFWNHSFITQAIFPFSGQNKKKLYIVFCGGSILKDLQWIIITKDDNGYDKYTKSQKKKKMKNNQN